MKHVLIAAILAATAVSAANAEDWSKGLTQQTRNEILQLVPNADLTGLSKAQVQRLEMFFDNSDNLRAGNNPSGKLQVILGS